MTVSTTARKKSVNNACMVCRRGKMKCDGHKPCNRCENLDKAEYCIYAADRRSDKRTFKDGSKLFLFKNQGANNVDIAADQTLSNRSSRIVPKTTELELPKRTTTAVNDRNFAGNKQHSVDNRPCNKPHPINFDFDDFIFEDRGVDEFLELLGESTFRPESEALSYSPNISGNRDTFPSTTAQSERTFIPRHELINVLFENISHIPPGLSNQHLLNLERHYQDLELAEGDNGERFLLSTVLCLGALTLRKRELLQQSNLPKKPPHLASEIPKAATDAYRYYNIAKGLVPDVLSRPSVNTFCGLAIMANFMTVMISLEGQLYLCINALQMAISLGMNEEMSSKNFTIESLNKTGLILLFWNVWCSSCMLATFLGKDTFFSLEDIRTPLPRELSFDDEMSQLSNNFMQLRVQLADIQIKVFRQCYFCKPTDIAQFTDLEKELDNLSIEVFRMKGYAVFEENMYFRARQLMLELSSLRAQAGILMYLPQLIEKRSLQAVAVAKSIIYEIWGHYTKQFAKNENDLANHLDWNFCYPLRTASLTLWLSCIILLKYEQSVKFLRENDLFEYKLALGVLQYLVELLPIEKNLINLLQSSNNSATDEKSFRTDEAGHFWFTMLGLDSKNHFDIISKSHKIR